MVSNMSHEGPCFCGIQPGQHVAQADVGLLVDVDVPWFPRDTKANEATFWAQVDVDVIKGGSPMWSFPSQLRLQGNSAHPHAASRRAAPEGFARVPRGRRGARRKIQRRAGKPRATRRRAGRQPGKPGAINSHYLLAELGKRIDANDIVFAEATRNTPAVIAQIRGPVQGTMVRVGGGGLGSSGGMALGAKLARPSTR